MEINGKKVIVIGGASGMGRASAELLHARGASVAIFDREGSDGKDVAAGIDGDFYPIDVTDFVGTEETLNAAVDKLGGLHVTVTCRPPSLSTAVFKVSSVAAKSVTSTG